VYSVFQHWDPLKTCIVGRSYPPEFYSWIKESRVRKLFEKIAEETEEDFQNIIKKLESFGVEVLRPELPNHPYNNGRYIRPPMTPRDHMIMIGNTFYENWSTNFNKLNYVDIKDSSWPDCNSWDEFNNLPAWIKNECIEVFNFGGVQKKHSEYDQIVSHILKQGNTVKTGATYLNGANTARLGKDLFIGTNPGQSHFDIEKDRKHINSEFINTRNHIIDTQGHSDSTYCPVCPGLIISLCDISNYSDTFPDWEVVYLPDQSWEKVKPFLDLKSKNGGKWWIPGFEYDSKVIETVESWLCDWVGYVEETVFDVNMLIVDPKNVIVFNHNDKVFEALERYGITPHVVPFRHRYFWDGGIHCITADLDREGVQQDFFKQNSKQNSK